MNQLPENSLLTYDVTLVTLYFIGLGYHISRGETRLSDLRSWLALKNRHKVRGPIT